MVQFLVMIHALAHVCEFRLVPIAIVVCCELGGEMAFCYHLGRICFRIA